MGATPIVFVVNEVNNNIGDFRAFRAWVCENYEDELRRKRLFDKLNAYEEPTGKQVDKIKELYAEIEASGYDIEKAKELMSGFFGSSARRSRRSRTETEETPSSDNNEVPNGEEVSDFAERDGE